MSLYSPLKRTLSNENKNKNKKPKENKKTQMPLQKYI